MSEDYSDLFNQNNYNITGVFFIYLQFVSHPLAYRLLNQRWNYGLPPRCLPGKKLRLLLYIFTILDTILTPVLFPVITYVFYKDQAVCPTERGQREERSLRGLHLFFFYLKIRKCFRKRKARSILPILFVLTPL